VSTWRGAPPPEPSPIGAVGWGLVAIRGPALALWIFGLLAVHMLVRLVERPLVGLHRPASPWITVLVCRGALAILGIGWRRSGPVMRGQGAMVANHSSWLDIFALNAFEPLYFVAKSEVEGWPGVGLLARATGTVFIRRDRREARAQRELFEKRLRARHRLLFFPEGTSTDGRRVLPFKTTLFGAFFGAGLSGDMEVQPVSVVYHPPEGGDPRFYGWWGDMEFGSNLLMHLATRRPGSVEVIHHAPLRVADYPDRKSLAWSAEAAVRGGVEAALGPTARQ
jgi:lyso-ornithine lipid O-acyltransferase